MLATDRNPVSGPTPGRLRALRAMYLANVVGAGVPGALMTAAPDWAMASMFGGPQDRIVFGMTGAIWLSIGLLSLVGLRRPVALAGIFLVQILYKAVWIAAVAVPMLVAGDRAAEVVPYTAFFGLVVLLWILGVPFATVLGRGDGAAGRPVVEARGGGAPA